MPLEPLGLNANQWQFLKDPDKYFEASKRSERPLVLESTRRQFLTARDILARLNGSCKEEERRGILLADDAGLGKTTVAALVAWVVARAGDASRRVRILAPNKVMKRRWVEELRNHVNSLQDCAPAFQVNEKLVKEGGGRLNNGRIQVVTHHDAVMDSVLDCDLLIIDEAHRAKGDLSKFARKIRQSKKCAKRILILTATPFSIDIKELNNMLSLIGGGEAHRSVNAFSKALNDLYSGDTARDPREVAERLAAKASAAVEAIAPFVIRHGIDDLPREQKSFGDCDDWNIDVPKAQPEELELLMRMDRVLRVANNGSAELSKAATDARFHVGWQHFDEERERLKSKVPLLPEPAIAVVKNQLKSIKTLRDKVRTHSKVKAVAEVVKATIAQGEKVVLFCHHHATAEELTLHLALKLPKATAPQSPGWSTWEKAWNEVLGPADEVRDAEILRDTFIKWLCADLICAQTWDWLRAASVSASKANLADALKKTNARPPHGRETIADAAQSLYHALLKSPSSRGVLKKAAEDRLELLPGANDAARVLGVCDPSGNQNEESLFLHNRQPDTVISIFNSPFGPDVLVVTDKLSEGIDLHRYCRHLIHYELDPSPIRTVQRNGRLRRVKSWAAATGQPILYSYPAFRGTRDEQLVKIMKKRIVNFSLLLGGVREFDVGEVGDQDEKWRTEAIACAKKDLEKAGRHLCAQEPG
ncbi:MAG: SNF2-related protein [Gemmataceae bacterium]